MHIELQHAGAFMHSCAWLGAHIELQHMLVLIGTAVPNDLSDLGHIMQSELVQSAHQCGCG